jgi:hypothetical protein
VKTRTHWLYTPVGAIALATICAVSFVLGYVLHPV